MDSQQWEQGTGYCKQEDTSSTSSTSSTSVNQKWFDFSLVYGTDLMTQYLNLN